ncbi:Rv1535 domain-containing protein [Rhodococcus opacus]|uniref:Rv1535 domain-containing protein n=1 Tax=Rhodococcus opacus TaxID=37919 RepID=UPI003B007D39
MLTPPLREVYAVLLRAGVIEIVESPASFSSSAGANAAAAVAAPAHPSAWAQPTGPSGVHPSS